MSVYVNFPFINPFKFVPVTATPGIHFDDKWAYEQILTGERNIAYRQKWQRSDVTYLQIESSIPPNDLQVYRLLSGNQRALAKEIEWTEAFAGVAYKVYELEYDISDLGDGIFVNYQVIELLAIRWEAISEPIQSKVKWPGTLGFRYKNSFNDFDVAWTTGIKMFFRCEAAIPPRDFDPQWDRSSYVNQNRTVKTTKGRRYRTFRLHTGTALPYWNAGVAPWVLDLLSDILICDWIEIEEKRFQLETDAKWEKATVKDYPLVWGTIEIAEANDSRSLQFSSTAPLAPGLVTSYNIETDFFGPGAVVPVTEVEENG